MKPKYSLLRHAQTGFKAIRNNETGVFIREIDSPVEYQALRKIAFRNSALRAKNMVLRELCGTSARAARLDMGI